MTSIHQLGHMVWSPLLFHSGLHMQLQLVTIHTHCATSAIAWQQEPCWKTPKKERKLLCLSPMYSKMHTSNKSPPLTKAMAELRTGSDQPEWCSKSNHRPLHIKYKSDAQADGALHLLICPLCHCFMHVSSSTHTLREPTMNPGLMHRTTQLKTKMDNTPLQSRH